MTDARREWISKRAYALWEAAGYPHGHDGQHWEQAERERDEFEAVRPRKAAKPLIEISAAPKAAARKKTAEAAKPASRKKAAKTATADEAH